MTRRSRAERWARKCLVLGLLGFRLSTPTLACRLCFGLSAVMTVFALALAARLTRTIPGDLPYLTPAFSSVCAWTVGTCVILYGSIRATSPARIPATGRWVRQWGRSYGDAAWVDLSGVGLTSFVTVGFSVFLVGCGCAAGAAGTGLVGRVLASLVASLFYALLFSAACSSLLLSAFTIRPRALGYVALSLLLVVPQWATYPDSLGTYFAIPQSLARARASLAAGSVGGFLSSGVALTAIAVVAGWVYSRRASHALARVSS